MEKDKRVLLIPIILFPIWLLLYFNLGAVTDFLIYSVAGLEKGSHLTDAIWFFVFEVPKVLMLLMIIVFVVGIISNCRRRNLNRKSTEVFRLE